jgi:hypothetical protein
MITVTMAGLSRIIAQLEEEAAAEGDDGGGPIAIIRFVDNWRSDSLRSEEPPPGARTRLSACGRILIVNDWRESEESGGRDW